MYYVKVLKVLDKDNLEGALNQFYQEAQKKGHRIMYTRPHWFEHGRVDVLMIVNDDPHPHYGYGKEM